jgi:hypothetical protein
MKEARGSSQIPLPSLPSNLDFTREEGFIPKGGHDWLIEMHVGLWVRFSKASQSAPVPGNEIKYFRRPLSSFSPGLAISKYLGAAGINEAMLKDFVFVDSPLIFNQIPDLLRIAPKVQNVSDAVCSLMALQLVATFAKTGLLRKVLYDALNPTATKLRGARKRTPRKQACQAAMTNCFGVSMERVRQRVLSRAASRSCCEAGARGDWFL